jgi:hypothetical protein
MGEEGVLSTEQPLVVLSSGHPEHFMYTLSKLHSNRKKPQISALIGFAPITTAPAFTSSRKLHFSHDLL